MAIENDPAPTNLNEDLSAAWDETMEAAEAVEAETAPEVEEVAEIEATESTVTDPDEEVEAEVAEESDEIEVEEPTEEDHVEGLVAPDHWSATDREMFEGLDDGAKEFVQRRYASMEKDYHSKTQKAASAIKLSDSIEGMLAPFKEKMQLAGIDDVTAISKLVAAQALLERDPKAGIEHLAKSYGVDLDDVDVEYDEADPNIARLEEKIRLMEGNQSTASLDTWNAKIEQFKDAADGQGKLLHPHFDEVYDDMVTLVKSQVAGDIDTAYQKAIWSNETVRSKMLESVQADTKKSISTANAEKTAKAKRAAIVNRKGNGDAQADVGSELSLIEELSKNYDAA